MVAFSLGGGVDLRPHRFQKPLRSTALAIEMASFLGVSLSGFVKNEQICIEIKAKKI